MADFKNGPDQQPNPDDYKGVDSKPVYKPKGPEPLKTVSGRITLPEDEPTTGNHVHPTQPTMPDPVPFVPPIEPGEEATQAPQPDDNEPQVKQHTINHPFEDENPYDLLKGFNEQDQTILNSVIMPAGTHKLITDFVEKYKDLIDNSDANRTLTDVDAVMVNNVNGTDTIGLREETLIGNKGVNSLKHEGVELTGKKVKFDVSNTEVSGQIAVTVFNSIVNQTDIFSHNLPSSGFSISLIDIPEVDIAKLAKILNRTTVRKSRETRGNLHSNYGMMVMKEIMDFVTGYVYSTSIDVDSYRLSDYIRITDMPIVMLLLMEYIHQKGFEVITSCANTMVYEDDKPKCTATIKAVVDLRKLLVVDPDKLETWARKHLSNTSKHAHSVETVTKYQDTLPSNNNKTYKITSGNETFEIELRNPTMTEAFEAMDQWEEMIRDGVSDITIGKNDEEIAELLSAHSLKTVLGMYLHFIVSITTLNGTYVVDRETILQVIVSFNSNREVVADIVKAVKDYIGESTVGFVGYTPYVCKQCGHENGGSDIIALDMPSLGFNLVDLATLKMTSSPHIF